MLSYNPLAALGKIQLLNRKKADPTQFVFTGDETTEAPNIQLFVYTSEQVEEKQSLDAPSIVPLRELDQQAWLNVYGLSDTEAIAHICKKQGIDNLVIQDILDIHQRPKFQEFEDYCFLTIKTTVPTEERSATEQISFVFGKNYLLSFQEKKADYFDHLRFRLRENKGLLRQKGPDFLLYTLLEAILDNYFKTLNQIAQEASELSISNINSDPSPAILEDIEQHKVFVQFIKNAIHPIREFVAKNERDTNPFIEKSNLKYFQEIKDLCLTLLERCDAILAALESSINLFFSVQGHRMNQVMKTLTVVATIFIPLTFVAGIYGMNFTKMPELDWKYGYPAFWGLILLMLAGMLIYFRQKRWF